MQQEVKLKVRATTDAYTFLILYRRKSNHWAQGEIREIFGYDDGPNLPLVRISSRQLRCCCPLSMQREGTTTGPLKTKRDVYSFVHASCMNR